MINAFQSCETSSRIMRHQAAQQIAVKSVFGNAQYLARRFQGQTVAGKGHHAVEKTQGVTHAAVGLAGYHLKCLDFGLDFFLAANKFEAIANGCLGNTTEVEALHAGENGMRNLADFCGGKDEYHMRRWFFQGLQQGVESVLGQHVHFVNDVNLILALHGGVFDLFAQVTDIVHTVVGSAVDFQHVHGRTLVHGNAIFADFAGRGRGSLFTVQSLGENACGGGFPHSAGAGEQKRMGDAAGRKGVAERLGDMLLSHHFFEILRPPFAGHD